MNVETQEKKRKSQKLSLKNNTIEKKKKKSKSLNKTWKKC